MNKVTIMQHRLMHYRVSFFERLKSRLQQNGIDLALVHGQATRREKVKNDEGYLPWATKIRNLFVEIKSVDVIFQLFPLRVFKSDVIVLMQENRIISNYLIMLLAPLFRCKVAFWGHGANFQSLKPQGLKERFKAFMVNKVDHWFAYTEATVDILKSRGVTAGQITCLNNAIDNDEFVSSINSINAEMVNTFYVENNIPQGSDIGLFCGSLYKEKRIDELIEAVFLIRKNNDKFVFIVIGDGSESHKIRELTKLNDWIIYLGVKKGIEKALLFKISKIILNPGLVGLHILDSFYAGKPMVTLASSMHSPEISYLKSGLNGFVVDGGVNEYANACSSLLSDVVQYQYFSENAIASSKMYTLELMVDNFATGLATMLKKRGDHS